MPMDAPASIRAFVAVEINSETREALTEIQATLRNAGAHVAWVAPENLHVSLAFLGDTVTDLIPRLAHILDDVAALTPPFPFDVANLGAFGRPDSPRVIWAGVKKGEPLTVLQRRVADDLRGLGIALETPEFVPHLTLGRVRSSRGCRPLIDALRSTGEIVFGHVEASRVVLMRSVLASGGAQYSIVHGAQFKG